MATSGCRRARVPRLLGFWCLYILFALPADTTPLPQPCRLSPPQVSMESSAERPVVIPIVIRSVRLFDSPEARVLPERTVVIKGRRIAAVGPAETVEIPANAIILDGRGKTLLPGLWDMHGHVTEDDGPLYLSAGVTGVRDLGNHISRVLYLRERWNRDEDPSLRAAGPHLVLAGYINGPGPASSIGQTVETSAEVCDAVRLYADLGYHQLKLYNHLPEPLIPLILDEARAQGLGVGGHIPNVLTTRQAVDAGLDEIHHLNALFRDFLAPGGYIDRARQIGEVNLESQEMRAFVRLLATRGLVVDPTLSVFEDAFLGRPGRPTPGWARVLPRLPDSLRQEVEGKFLPLPPEHDPVFRRAFDAYRALTRQLHAAGVQLVAGTDQPAAGLALHRELELYVEAGIPAGEVLRIATLDAARVAGMGEETGSIEAGKLADLILVPGDPTQDISALRRVEWVLKAGRLLCPEALARSVGVRPESEEPPGPK